MYICTIYLLVHKKIYLSLITNYQLRFQKDWREGGKERTYTKIITADCSNNRSLGKFVTKSSEGILRKSKKKKKHINE